MPRSSVAASRPPLPAPRLRRWPTPLWWDRMAGVVNPICPTWKRNIFRARDGQTFGDLPVGSILSHPRSPHRPCARRRLYGVRVRNIHTVMIRVSQIAQHNLQVRRRSRGTNVQASRRMAWAAAVTRPGFPGALRASSLLPGRRLTLLRRILPDGSPFQVREFIPRDSRLGLAARITATPMPSSGAERKSRFGAVRAAPDPNRSRTSLPTTDRSRGPDAC